MAQSIIELHEISVDEYSFILGATRADAYVKERTTRRAPRIIRRPGHRCSTPASLHARAPELYRAQFTTTKGDFIVEVHRDWAPLGADRFYNLVRHGFFTNAAFFRVVPGFVVQFGLSASPAINKVWAHAKPFGTIR